MGLVVHLIDQQQNRLIEFAQPFRQYQIIRRGTGLAVDHEQYQVRLLTSQVRLSSHGFTDDIPAGWNVAAGIDQVEAVSPPFDLAVNPVTGDAGGLLDYGLAAAHQPVKEGGLAHVGPADYGYGRFSHAPRQKAPVGCPRRFSTVPLIAG